MARERMTVERAAEVLGVPQDAPLSDVHRAYRRLARELHPDLQPQATDPERSAAAERFAEVVRARQLLVERRPVIPIRMERRSGPVRFAIPEGVGSALALVTLLVFVLLAIVSLADAYGVPGRTAPATPPSVVATAP